ncbi:MAG: 50S ribosomal protein L15 [Candidatus Bathyarchaeota archaeon]|nr:50S ribosomal protein L15 [Candidatus Bathyarchaeota archaeon]MDH5747351.1 50S ribosomal protein L15 [Candidatus Bathyarchaeota archaeon]
MPHKLRKTRKKRGSRTHGWGRVGQHRGGGQRGGHGKAGFHKHRWTYVIKYEPDYFGKKGFTSPKSLKRKVNAINAGTLDEIAEKLSTKKEGKLFIDLESLGYTKLLGTGKVTKPLTVKVRSCSKSAAEKIKEAGGQILIESEELE